MYPAEQRDIFPHQPPGGKVTYFDPLALRARLIVACQGDLYGALADAQECRQKDGESDEAFAVRRLVEDAPDRQLLRIRAQERLAAAAREAFRLPEFDEETGQGATQAQCWRALRDFLGWLAGNAGPARS